MRRIVAAVLAAVSIAAGCGVLMDQPFAASDELLGPWRAEPLSVDPATIAAGQRACHDRGEPLGPLPLASYRVVAADARGAGHLTLVLADAADASWACELRVDADGRMSMTGGAAVDAVGPPKGLAANEVRIRGGGALTPGELRASVTGRIGAGVSAVRVVLPDGSIVRASVGGGWFIAWWPTDEVQVVVEALDSSGRKVGEDER